MRARLGEIVENLERQDKWYRLDNSADLYPMSITRTTQSLFRLSAEMDSYVDGENLQSALVHVLPRFPTFAVQLRRGLFRYYFDSNDQDPVVFADDGILLKNIDFIKNNRYLFRVCYYKKRISVDFFHGLCDGSAALEFLKSLVYQYLDECGAAVPSHDGVKVVGEEIPLAEFEDSTMKYYSNYNLFGGVVGKMAGKNCFGLHGKRFKALGYGLIQGYMKADELKVLAKKYDCTVTVLIAALALLSIAKVFVKSDTNKDIVAAIPINLRKIFPSTTLYNFTTITKVSVNPAYTKPDLAEYVKLVKNQLAEGVGNKQELAEKMALSSFMSHNWFMQILPVGLKTFFIKFPKFITNKTKQTLIISNLGVVKLPVWMRRHVNRFAFNINISQKCPNNMGVVTFNGITTISFTRMLVATDFERTFFTTLIEEGVNVEVISNLREGKR